MSVESYEERKERVMAQCEAQGIPFVPTDPVALATTARILRGCEVSLERAS